MTSPHNEPTDRRLLDLLTEGMEQLEPVPQHAMEQAYSARFMAAMDAELAKLVFDSQALEQPAMRRGNENEARFLSFTNDNVTLDLSLLADNQTIVGEIDPAIATELVIEVDGVDSTATGADDRPDGPSTKDAETEGAETEGAETGPGKAEAEAVTVPIDQFGRFRVIVEADSFRLRVVNHLVTQWITR